LEEEGTNIPSHTTFASRLRVVGAVTAAGALTLGAMPALAAAPTDAPADAGSCVQLQLDNPHAGDTVPVGHYTVSGRAVDISGGTINRVQLFLEDRNLGGTPIGEADVSPGPSSPANVLDSSLGGNGRFTVLADTSSSNTDVGSHTLFAYATSSSGTEVSVAVPIVLGTLSGGAGGAFGSGLPSVSNAANCPAPSAPSNVVSPSAGSVTGTASLTAPSETISVTIDSPNPGATITRGRFDVTGRATTNTGGAVDRVQVFVGNRDLGGVEVGEITAANSPSPVPGSATLTNSLNANGTYHVVVDFPSQNLGVQNVFVYARSADTGKEASANTAVTINR
jgi:hypothetical protein